MTTSPLTPAEEPRSTAGGADESQNRRILIVEDSSDVAEMLKMLLELEGYQIRIALNGDSAVVIAQEFLPDIVLLDLGLPDISGYEVARRLRLNPTLARTIVIALSGYSEESHRQRSREAGFDHFLQKPTNLRELKKYFHSSRK